MEKLNWTNEIETIEKQFDSVKAVLQKNENQQKQILSEIDHLRGEHRYVKRMISLEEEEQKKQKEQKLKAEQKEQIELEAASTAAYKKVTEGTKAETKQLTADKVKVGSGHVEKAEAEEGTGKIKEDIKKTILNKSVK